MTHTDTPHRTAHADAHRPTAAQWQAEADRLAALPVRTVADEDAMRYARVQVHKIRTGR